MLHSYQGLREIVLELVEGYECRTVFWRTNTLIQTWGYRPAISKRFPLEILAEFGLEGPGVSIASGGATGCHSYHYTIPLMMLMCSQQIGKDTSCIILLQVSNS